MIKSGMPMIPGYYWAKWRIATDETHEGDELTPSNTWEVVAVNANVIDWDDDPTELEALSVAITGVRETQWRDQFIWGQFIAPLNDPQTTDAQKYLDALESVDAVAVDFGHFESAARTMQQIARKAIDEVGS